MRLEYTEAAKNDLKAIFNYISFDLIAPDAAERIVGRILSAIRSLQDSPEMYQLYRDNPWHDLGVRSFPVKNYVVFYRFKKEESLVTVIRIMYGGRDVSKQLEEVLNDLILH